MMVLITGGSGSGKSAYAEQVAGELGKDGPKYYLATMQVYDEEGQRRIERHRQMRSGKGFCTIEQPTAIEKALWHLTGNASLESTVLLECVSNLVANEMFAGETPEPEEQVVRKVAQGVESLKKGVGHLVVVTNNVQEDGILYDATTMEYLKAMGEINQRLAAMADEVVEVVAGIPVVVSGQKKGEN